ncbi:MAG TPA: bifunctional acetate--CoA ligase family protein/GNAT family N-acetyltransferase [Geminicoccaceae bacterium]|nr:bifunctional acetate--CoA ligase family protein/GNAT family N-acetyltransferase [Geminicoccaceae bacterium]
MSLRNLDKIFEPRRIALIGAHDDPAGSGLILLKNLLEGDFQGVVYPVDQHHEAIRGIATFPDLRSLPQTPDLALICSRAEDVPARVQECAEAGIRGLVIFSSGFRESDPAGAALQDQIGEIAGRFDDLRIIGPNSLGVIAPRFRLNASQVVTQPLPGHLAFICQSRALCNAIVDWATEQGIGFSLFVSIGNMVDVGFGDLIDYLNRDPHTRAIVLYVHSIEHARRFMSAARAFSRVKPIVAYKAGRFVESAEAAASHTGAMVAKDAVYDAAFERAGVVRVTELDDVFDVAELLASRRLPRGPRLAILSNAGGPAVIATDALLARGGVLPQLTPESIAELKVVLAPAAAPVNPIDLLDDAPAERFAEATKVCLGDRQVDAALVIFAVQGATDPLATAKAVADVAERSDKPVLAAWMGGEKIRTGVRRLNDAGVATHATPEQAVRAFMHLVAYARNLERLYETPRDLPVRFRLNRHKLRRRLRSLLRAKTSPVLTEDQARGLLKAYEIPFVEGASARSARKAVQIADRIGYPVALKILSPQILHKLDVGGVALDLADAGQVGAAFERMMETIGQRRSTIEIKGVSVQRMMRARDGIELILGAKKDPTFGAVLMVGSGGVTTDVAQDRALGLPPLDERATRAMLESLRAWPILQGYRGRPAVDVDRLVEVVMRFSLLITDYPEIREFEINPLLVTPRDVIALDAAVLLDRSVTAPLRDPHPHLAIRPYPEESVRRARLKDGTSVTLRAVRAEDEHRWHSLIASSSPESIRFRFRSMFKTSTHKMAVEHCFIDYDREIGLVAEMSEDAEIHLIGVAHLFADPNHDTAEFSVMVADAWQGRGLGGLLLDHCLELANRWGFRSVVAETDPDNRAMLAVFRSRGFAAQVRREHDVVYLTKSMARRRRFRRRKDRLLLDARDDRRRNSLPRIGPPEEL